MDITLQFQILNENRYKYLIKIVQNLDLQTNIPVVNNVSYNFEFLQSSILVPFHFKVMREEIHE